ncbi:hypothetical protein B0H13DRAFT_2325526 [Mycena leptocephala]|nr:hypothetical protein B0H13DRAFT_2325526 [Mycena leptocephala]
MDSWLRKKLPLERHLHPDLYARLVAESLHTLDLNCAIVSVSDTAKHMEALLTAIFLPEKFFLPDPTKLDKILLLLDVSTKYGVMHLRTRCIGILEDMCPLTLDAWDTRRARELSENWHVDAEDTLSDLQDCITILTKLELSWLLPAVALVLIGLDDGDHPPIIPFSTASLSYFFSEPQMSHLTDGAMNVFQWSSYIVGGMHYLNFSL